MKITAVISIRIAGVNRPVMFTRIDLANQERFYHFYHNISKSSIERLANVAVKYPHKFRIMP